MTVQLHFTCTNFSFFFFADFLGKMLPGWIPVDVDSNWIAKVTVNTPYRSLVAVDDVTSAAGNGILQSRMEG